jgi:hypothetical protein
MRHLDPRTRKLLWVCLLGLSTAIVLWPVAPSPYDPLPVQSIHAIPNLPWFIALFYIWAVVLTALLFLARGSVLEHLALCLVFSVVFIGFWGFVANPWGNSWDSGWLMGHVNYLQEMGKIPPGGSPTFRYFDFPGFSLLGLVVADITGTDIFLATRLYLLASGLLFTLILYVAFLKLLKTPYRAALGVVLAIASSMVLGVVFNQFHPTNLATIFIATFFLLLVTRPSNLLRDQGIVLCLLLLMMAATVGHMFVPVFFAMVLLGFYLLHRVEKGLGYASLSIAILPLVLFFSWLMYLTVFSFPTAVREVPIALQGILEGTWLVPVAQILRENVGLGYPWWGNTAKFFWWVSVFGFGTLLMLRRILAWRRAESLQRVELAVFGGVLATIIIGSFAGGVIGVVHGGLSRYIWVAPLVLAPALVDILSSPRTRAFAIAFVAVGMLLLPATFLTNADTISATRTYQDEIAMGEFLASSYQEGEGLMLYTLPSAPAIFFVCIPDAQVTGGHFLWGLTANEATIFSSLHQLVDDFHGAEGENNLLIATIKGRAEYQQRLDIPTDHPAWQSLAVQLSAAARIYDSGSLQLYAP